MSKKLLIETWLEPDPDDHITTHDLYCSALEAMERIKELEAQLSETRELLKESRKELGHYIDQEYPYRHEYLHMMDKRDCSMDIVRRIDKTLKRERGDCAATGWQPIGTAPKDGREVLGWSGVFIWIVHWNEVTKVWVSGSGSRLTLTHWMPLPETPEVSDEY